GYPLAVEFRHHSWFHADVCRWLGERGMDLVSVDVPDLPALYPSELVQSRQTIYVRFHSRNAQNWYRSDKERYDYDYDDAKLLEWIEAVRANPHQAERVLLLFNNFQRGQAAANAKRMRELLNRLVPEIEVVEPFARPEPGHQRLLFD